MKKLAVKLVRQDSGQPLKNVAVELLAETVDMEIAPTEGASSQRIFLERAHSNEIGVVHFSNRRTIDVFRREASLAIRYASTGEVFELPRSPDPLRPGVVELEIPPGAGMMADEEPFEKEEPVKHISSLEKSGYELDDLWNAPSIFSDFDELHFGDDHCSRLIPVDQTIRAFNRNEIVLLEKNVHECVRDGETVNVHRGESVHMDVRWTRLGYSFGDLLYSLALSPGESVTVAMSSWEQRQMAAARRASETGEAFIGRYNRASSLSETMEGTSSQLGFGIGNVIATGSATGLGTSSSSSGAANAQAEGIGIGLAAGLAQKLSQVMSTSIVNAINFSYNKNKFALNAAREFGDQIQQTAERWRRDHQTLVAEQSETEDHSVSYRTVCNKNYCKVLNVFYHEVLENHRVTTSLAGKQEALFIPYEVQAFDEQLAWCTKPQIAPFLIDQSLLPCYEALRRVRFGEKPEEESPETGEDSDSPDDLRATSLRLEISIGRNGLAKRKPFKVLLFLNDGSQQTIDVERDERWKRNSFYTYTLTASAFDPAEVHEVGLRNDSNTAVRVAEYVISFLDPIDGGWVELGRDSPGKLRGGSETSSSSSFQPMAEAEETGEEVETVPTEVTLDAPPSREDDEECVAALLEHLNCHSFFYNSLLWLMEDRNERIARLDEIRCGDRSLADLVDPSPIGIMGTYVVFPAAGAEFESEEDPEVIDDRLVTLPTSGVFADTALGQCSACEEVPAEDDPFWKWVEKPNHCEGADLSTKTPSESPILNTDNIQFVGAPKEAFATPTAPVSGDDAAQSLLDGFASELSSALLSTDPAVDISELSSMLEKFQDALNALSESSEPNEDNTDAPDPGESNDGEDT